MMVYYNYLFLAMMVYYNYLFLAMMVYYNYLFLAMMVYSKPPRSQGLVPKALVFQNFYGAIKSIPKEQIIVEPILQAASVWRLFAI
jgi:hypothetical protein